MKDDAVGLGLNCYVHVLMMLVHCLVKECVELEEMFGCVVVL